MISSIIFDLNGVVFTNGLRVFARQLSERYHLDYEYLRTEFSEGRGTSALYREGKITNREFWERVISKFGFKEPMVVLEKQWLANYFLFPETKTLIFKLKENYQVFYLSNMVNEEVEDMNNKYDFLTWFAGGVFSYKVGVRKPDQKIFNILLTKYKINPHEVIFIDDKEKNLPPARKLGMKTILFVSTEDLKVELNKQEIIV